MSRSTFALIYFLYGLAFFSMGLVVWLERGRGSDKRLRHALRPLAAFGVIHATHEWMEMFQIMGMLPGQETAKLLWNGLLLALLSFSFLSLAAFGASLLSPNNRIRRISLLLPLAMAGVWVFGLLIMRSRFPIGDDLMIVADVWTRYVLGIPAALVASIGLIFQQRAFRRAGMTRFGRDSLWAAVAFAWYGILGQAFTRESALPPSNVINQALFFDVFGFPVQLMRAAAAVAAAIFVVRFLRSFEVERRAQIAELQAARIREAEKREAMRGELLGRVVAAQEAERQRIARELHDETGQALTAAGLGLRGIATSLDQDPSRAASNLKQLEKMVSEALNELQRLIADLRPSHLDDLGLAATLRWWAEEVESRGSLKVDVKVSGEGQKLTPPVRLALFRVTQEALTNSIKHSLATQAHVELTYQDNVVSVLIADNGRGFDINKVMSDKVYRSWGLMGMQERASLLGGQVRVDSRPEAGTVVMITIPYQTVIDHDENEAPDDNTTPTG